MRYPVSGLTDRLYRLGANELSALSYKRTTAVPCQADAAAQTAFLTDLLVPLLKVAEAGKAVAYFADAAHPPPNPPATQVRTEVGRERPLFAVSAHERVNHNAACNAHCPTQVHLDETDCINAQSTWELYQKLLIAHPEGPVHVVCDNARHYLNKALTA